MKTKNLRVGFVQTLIKTDQPFLNLHDTLTSIAKLVKKHCNLILLPEVCLGSPSSKTRQADFDQAYKELFRSLTQISQAFSVSFFGSSYDHSGTEKKNHNTAFLINPDQKNMQKYQKIHLFRFSGEHRVYSSGKKSQTFSSPWGTLAPLICYDVRFPELLRKMAFKGAKLALVCAQWPVARVDHWQTLLQARAIENQIFVLAANCRGKRRDMVFKGHSCVISPWGEILFLLKEKGFGFFDLDLNLVNRVRKKYPFFRDALKNKFQYEI